MHKKDFFRLNRMVILKQRNSCFGQDCACMTPVFVQYWARREASDPWTKYISHPKTT